MKREPHPLVEKIKRWADDPEAWQWQNCDKAGNWFNCGAHEVIFWVSTGRLTKDRIRLVPKRNMIPAHLLPEGWEVERRPEGRYLVGVHGSPARLEYDDWLNELLRHIDKEAT